MAQPPKRIFTDEELLANKNRFVKVNAAGDGYEGADGADAGNPYVDVSPAMDGGDVIGFNLIHADNTEDQVLFPESNSREYVAYVAQTGTDAPTAVIVTNTLGEVPSYGYTQEGLFVLTTVGSVFTTNKTVVENVIRDSRNGDAWMLTEWVSETQIQIQSKDATNNANGILAGWPQWWIRITVYN